MTCPLLDPYLTSDVQHYLCGLLSGLGLAIAILFFAYQFVLLAFRPTFTPPKKGGAILITGASTGIGNHAAQHLAKEGFVVYATVRKHVDAEELNKLGLGSNLRPIIMDVSQPDTIEAGTKQILAELAKENRPLVGLVNNAGTWLGFVCVWKIARQLIYMQTPSHCLLPRMLLTHTHIHTHIYIHTGVAQKFPLEFHPLKDLRRMFDIHLLGPLDLTQRLLPSLRASKGRIVNLTSITSSVVLPTGAAYGSSKLAVEAISVGLRRELADMGVSVSMVQPAFVNTAIFDKVCVCVCVSSLSLSPLSLDRSLTYIHTHTHTHTGLQEH